MTRESGAGRENGKGMRLADGGVGRFAPEDNLDRRSVVTLRKDRVNLLKDVGRQIDVVGGASLLVVEMSMRAEIRTITRRATFEVNCSNEATLHQRFQAVVHCRQRDGRHVVPHACVDFIGRWMIALIEERVEDHLTLRGSAQAAVRQLLRQYVSCRCAGGNHVGREQQTGMVLSFN